MSGNRAESMDVDEDAPPSENGPAEMKTLEKLHASTEEWLAAQLRRLTVATSDEPDGVLRALPTRPDVDMDNLLGMLDQIMSPSSIVDEVAEIDAMVAEYQSSPTPAKLEFLLSEMDTLGNMLQDALESFAELKETIESTVELGDLREQLSERKRIRVGNLQVLNEFEKVTLPGASDKFNRSFQSNMKRMSAWAGKLTVSKKADAERSLVAMTERVSVKRDKLVRHLSAQRVAQEAERESDQKTLETVEHIERSITGLRRELDDAIRSLRHKRAFVLSGGSASPVDEHDPVEGYPSITDPPVVQIFEMAPPPSINFLQHDFSLLQKEVMEKFGQFQWTNADGAASGCDTASSRLNNAQKLSYHYMQPYNNNVNVMLVHSPGSGKSCTGALIASVFARAGYTIMIVSTRTLKMELEKASIDNVCDFNLQQFTRGRTLLTAVLADIRMQSESGQHVIVKFQPLLPAAVEPYMVDGVLEEDKRVEFSKLARDYAKTEILQKGMGVDYYTQEMSYEQLSNIASKDLRGAMKALVGESGNRTQLQEERVKYNDKLRKVFLVIDEAHKLVGGAEGKYFKKIRQVIWDSYKKSGNASCRVLLLTATPVAEHPMDAVNLATLLRTEADVRRLNLENYDRLGDDGGKQATGVDFMKKHWNSKTQDFNTGSVRKFQELFNGRLSYFNYVGDKSRFAQPEVHYVPVKLTLTQANQIDACLKDTTMVATKARAQQIIQQTSNRFVYRVEDSTLMLAKQDARSVKGRRGGKKKAAAVAGPRATKASGSVQHLTKCVAENMMWPRQVTPLNGSLIERAKDSKNLTAQKIQAETAYLEDLREVRAASELVWSLLNQVLMLREKASRDLAAMYRASSSGIENKLEGYKQYIFSDLPANSHHGVKLLEAVLTAHGFIRINRRTQREDVIAHRLGEDDYYRGMIVFDETVAGLKPAGTKAQKELLEYFNSNDNVDGRHCLLFLGSREYKEGISLRHIRFVHIAGFLQTHADMIQAVARAIRNCSRKGTYYRPGVGWGIEVSIYSPSFPRSGSGSGSGVHPLELVELANSDAVIANTAKEVMNRIIKDTAYDHLVLERINTASAANDGAVQLWKGRGR